jgi:hypothetical protein
VGELPRCWLAKVPVTNLGFARADITYVTTSGDPFYGISSYLQKDTMPDSETYVKIIRTCLLYGGATTQLRTIYFDNVFETGKS